MIEIRTINLFYGTHYKPEDLNDWEEGDIQEAIALATVVSKAT